MLIKEKIGDFMKKIEKINNSFADDIDNIALLVERMQEVNKVVFDACSHTCDNNSTNPDVVANNYCLINNQSRILIMTIILMECIDELENIHNRLGDNYSDLMECRYGTETEE